MALTITKAKAKAAPALPKVESVLVPTDLTQMTIEQLADLYGDLEDRINAIPVNPIYTQFSEVQKEVASRLKNDVPQEAEATIKGDHWMLEVGACAKNPRKLMADAVTTLQKLLSKETFAAIAKVNLGDIDKYLTPEQAGKVVDSNTGYSDKRKIIAKFLG